VEGDLPPGLPIKTDVHVTLQADINGTLKVTADVPSSSDVKIHAVLNWKETTGNGQSIPMDGRSTAMDDRRSTDNGNEVESGSTWKDDAMMVRFMAAAVREEGRNIMPPNLYDPIVQLGDQLEMALQVDDEVNGRRIMGQLSPMVENLIFVNVTLAKIIKQDPELPRKIGMQKAEQLAKALNRLDQLRQMSRGDEYVQVYKTELEGLINEIMGVLSSGGSGGFTDLLGKASSSWGTG
jgi:hypothetical protein